jgi:hypothetical protein
VKVAITDACIFIDLHDLNLTNLLFKLPIEVHTSVDVFNELYTNQKDVLLAFHSMGILSVHNITGLERIEIYNRKYPKSLSNSDTTVLFLAEKFSAIILSSDKQVRNNAKARAIEYHGMFWIFDNLIFQNLITKEDAIYKLNQLITTNIIYQNSAELKHEMNKRIRAWKKL